MKSTQKSVEILPHGGRVRAGPDGSAQVQPHLEPLLHKAIEVINPRCSIWLNLS